MRSLAEELKSELRQIDAAVDEFAIQSEARPGRGITFQEMSRFLPAGSRLRENPVDPLGTAYPKRFVAGSRPRVPAASAVALSAAIGADFWAPFVVEVNPRVRPALIPPPQRAALPVPVAPKPTPVAVEPIASLPAAPKLSPTPAPVAEVKPAPTPEAAPTPAPVVEAEPVPTPLLTPLRASPTPGPAEAAPTPLLAETSEEQARLISIAKSIRGDLQILQSAIERYASEKGRRGGTVTFDELKQFLNPESRLAVIGTDQLGNGFPDKFRVPGKDGKPSPDLRPAPSSKTLVAGVTPPGFWAPFE